MVLSTRRSRHRLATKVAGALFAVFALVLQPIVALNVPAAFASSPIAGVSATVKAATPFYSAAVDGTQFTDLTLSFDYDSRELDANPSPDVFTYGWSAGGTTHNLGTIIGLSGESDPAEVGTVSAAIPSEALVSGLLVFGSVAANTSSDNVKLTNLTLNGMDIPATPPVDDEFSDTTKPTVTYVAPGVDAQRLNSTQSIRIDFTDDVALKQTTVHGYLGGLAVTQLWQHPLVNTTTHTIELPLTNLAEGTYQIRAAATDQAGNAIQVNRTFILDDTKPTVSIKAGTGVNDGSFSNMGAYGRISFKLHDAHGKLKEVVLNGHSYTRGGSWADLNWQNIIKSHIVDGVNEIYVVDAAGNMSTALTFVFDKKGPTITVKNESLGDTATRNFHEVSFKLFDSHQIDKVVLNGAMKDLTNNTWSDVNGVKPGVFGAAEGENILEAYDVFGNVSVYEFTIDTTAPGAPTLLSPADGATVNASTPVANDWEFSGDSVHHYTYESYDLNEDGTCNYSASRGWYMFTESETSARTIDDGTKFCWRVRVIDAAMNVGEWSDTWFMTVDNSYVPPVEPEEPTTPGEENPTPPEEEVEGNEGEKEVEVANENNNVAPERLPSLRLPIANPAAVTTLTVAPQQTDTDAPEVLSATDKADAKKSTPLGDTADVLGANTISSGLFGTAWYWWLAGIAAIVAIWWMIAGMRRRGNEA